MKTLFICQIVSKEESYENAGVSIAGNKMQLNFLASLKKQFPEELDCFSFFPGGGFRTNKKIFYGLSKRNIENIKVTFLPYLNIPFIRKMSQLFSLSSFLLVWLIKNFFKRKVIIVYNTQLQFLIPILIFSRPLRGRSVGFIADLPICSEYLRADGLLHFIELLSSRIQLNLLKCFNGLILLSKYVSYDFAPSVPFICIEGGVSRLDLDFNEISVDDKTRSCEKIKILYTGTVDKTNGVDLLIQAFEQLKGENLQLRIFGKGPLDKDCREAMISDKRVFFGGYIDNESSLFEQRTASVLVIPRPVNNLVSKYTFPSKLVEYLCSRTPVVSTPLVSIPQEYSEFINFSKSDDPTDIATCIKEVIDSLEYTKKSKAFNAAEFMIREKSWDIIAQKISQFLIEV